MLNIPHGLIYQQGSNISWQSEYGVLNPLCQIVRTVPLTES